MNIKEYPIKDLIPYENNPRNNKEAVEYVANSIREFGFKVPIVIDKDMVIVAGHTRLLAAKKLGLESVPCIVADDLTPDQIKAFRLADNKTGEFASWDFEKLEFELDELGDFDMEQFGFTFEDDEEDIQIIEDEAPEVQEKTTIQRGDVFELGNHRLMCGDATNKEEIETLINGEDIDLVLTDPPYGIDIISGGAGTIGTGNWPTGKVGGERTSALWEESGGAKPITIDKARKDRGGGASGLRRKRESQRMQLSPQRHIERLSGTMPRKQPKTIICSLKKSARTKFFSEEIISQISCSLPDVGLYGIKTTQGTLPMRN